MAQKGQRNRLAACAGDGLEAAFLIQSRPQNVAGGGLTACPQSEQALRDGHAGCAG